MASKHNRLSEDQRNKHDSRQVTHADDDGGDVDLKNYKGIYANEDNNQKYQCPHTGAHFEVKDLCRRLVKVIDKRKETEQVYV